MGDSPSALDVSARTKDSKDRDHTSNGDQSKFLNMAGSSARIEELKYLYASNVNVSNFVSEKLSGDQKYHVWKAQMVCLMETQKMHGIVDPKFVGPGVKDPDIIKQYDNLLRGWILGSLSEDVLSTVVDLDSARAVWKKLKSIYDPVKSSTQDSAPALPQPSTQIEIVTVTETESKDNTIRNKKLRDAMVKGRWWEAEAILKKAATEAISNEAMLKNPEKAATTEATNNGAEAIQKNPEKAATEAVSNRAENIWKNSEKADTEAISNRSEAICKNPEKAATTSNGSENIRKKLEKAATESEAISNKTSWKFPEKAVLEAINNKADPIWKLPEIVATEAIGNKAEAIPENAERKTATEAEAILKTAKRTAVEAEVITKTAKKTAMEAEAIMESARELMNNKAKAILRKAKKAATEAISNDGNTMLHLAVGIGQNDFVEKLLDFIDDGKEIEKKNSDGFTALHIAAIVGNKNAAELLVKKRKELLAIPDNNVCVPLLSAYYNMQLNTFVYLMEEAENRQQAFPLGLLYGPGFRTGVNLLITAIFTKQYNLASKLVNIYPELARKDDQVLMAMATTFPSELGFGERLIYPSLNNIRRKIVKRYNSRFDSYEFLCVSAKEILWAMRRFKSNYYSRLLPEMVLILLVPAAMFYPIYQLIRLFILVLFCPFFVLYFFLWKVLATVVAPIKRIEKKKKDYKEAKEILKSVCDHIDKLSFSGSHHRCYSRPILEAACQGAYEVVDEILSRFPKAIDCKNEKGLNIIQLAVINRSEKIYNLIYHIVERKDFYRTVMDSSKNNILHLVGRLAPSRILSRTTGAALQIQRELQWREELEKLVCPEYITKENIFKETPKMVFTREHENLVKEGEKWMKTTAESCSITAALITTIVFAAAITVPGGSNQETGIPVFKETIAFTIFEVADAISLFASTTALLVFLSILTARFSEQDFLVSLPRRLIIGLCTLFLSATTMLIAFSATLFLVFVGERKWMLGPIGVLTCLPIAVFVTLQFPLVVDLFRSTYFPIFGKQSYIERGKFNPNNIQYFFGNGGIQYVFG